MPEPGMAEKVDDTQRVPGAGLPGLTASPLTVLWRKKAVLISVFLTFTVTAAVVSKTLLDNEYEASATLLITQEQQQQSFDAVQAAQVLARTYAEIIQSENVAGLASPKLPGRPSAGEVKQRMSFETVPETQLVEVTAVAPNANEAQLTANTYADAVVQYAEDNLNDPNDAQVTVADRAILPGQPARPRPTLYTVLAALIGLVVGAAAALLAGMLDRRVRSVEELNELTGVPILAHIALARGRRARSLNAEAYRVLRANMEFARPGMPLRAVAIVSPSEGEGKSSAVINLARAVAEVGDRVIVVEGDLRRPAIQAALMAGTSGRLVPGLSNYLAGKASLEDVVYPTDMPHVSLVPSGPTPPSPSALLESKPGGRLLAGLSDRADLVIVDTPPVSVGADASLLAAAADETLMVVDLHRSTKSAIRAAVTQLTLAQADIVGVLLNRVRDPGGTAGYDYGYYEFEDKRSTGRRRIPGLGRRQTSQLEDVPSPEVLPTPEIVPTDPTQPDEGAHLHEDEGHDDVRPGRVLADAGHEESDQRSGDR